MIILREITTNSDWDAITKCAPTPLTQTFAYGEIQIKTGRNVFRFAIENKGQPIGYVAFVSYPLISNVNYWYAPYGPVLTTYSQEILSSIKLEIKTVASKHNVAFVRLDLIPTLTDENKKIATRLFTTAHKSSYIGAYFQPRTEWYTHIAKSPEEILATMHSKTRYSVRLAEKKGVSTRVTASNLLERLPDFIFLMTLTAKRNGFSLHTESYYKNYFEEAEKTGQGFVIEARFGDKVLASHFVFVVGDVAHYIFGATSDEHKDLCAPYLAHYAAMLKAKEIGAQYYNFGAVSLEGQNSHWQGLTIFKQKFGGNVVAHSSLYDLVLKPFWYYIYIIRKIIKSYI